MGIVTASAGRRATTERVLFFGVWQAGRPGHYLSDRQGGGHTFGGPYSWMSEFDGKLPPLADETERRATVAHIHGWTALAMWDRTGDGRGRSNAVFWVRGYVGFDDALTAAREAFPHIVARIGEPITLCVEGA